MQILGNMSQKFYINLAAFRKDNNLSQEDVAKILGTTRGLVSMVESGKAKLTEEKIDKIYQVSRDMFYDLNSFCPAWFRIQQLQNFLLKLGDYGLLESEAKKHFEDAEGIISEELEHAIKYGYSTINEQIANALIDKWPRLDRNWLLTGEGECDRYKSGSDIYEIREWFIELNNEIKKLRGEIARLLEFPKDSSV